MRGLAPLLIAVCAIALSSCTCKSTAATDDHPGGPTAAPVPNPAAPPSPRPTAQKPPSGPAKAAPASGKISGLTVAKRVLAFVRALDPTKEFVLKATTNEGYAWIVRYEVRAEGQAPASHAVFVSIDGRYMSNTVTSIRQRIEHVHEQIRVGRCLLDKGVRVYVDASEKPSQEQILNLGLAADYVVIDCRGDRRKLCLARGVEAFPSVVWAGGGAVGLRRLDWFQSDLKCP